MMQRRILQIIPADGWLIVYDHSVGDVDDLRTRPVVCWALVEDQTGTSVIGMDSDIIAGHRQTGRFLGYARTGEPLARFKRPAQ